MIYGRTLAKRCAQLIEEPINSQSINNTVVDSNFETKMTEFKFTGTKSESAYPEPHTRPPVISTMPKSKTSSLDALAKTRPKVYIWVS